jgi:lipopolysaccharide/colanic/teichoic acid biosynthesis glycosyltransferase
VRPGITGWAQVSGRGEITHEDKIELDLYYVEHRSLWFDIKILLRTLGALRGGKAIYERQYSRDKQRESDQEGNW